MGIPSVFRSIWASVKVWFYGVGDSCYHAVESLKSALMGFKILQAVGHANRAIMSLFVTMYQSIKIPVCHLGDYVVTVWEGFRTGTQKLEQLIAKEKQWGRDLMDHLDDGKNYVSGAVHHVFDAISGFFAKIWQAIANCGESIHACFSNAGAKVKEGTHDVWVKLHHSAGAVGQFFKSTPAAISNLFTKAPGVVKEKAQYIVVQIHDTATDAATRVKIAVADLMQMIKGAGEKLHEEEVIVKTVAHNIHTKAEELAVGVKVGTIDIIQNVGQKGKVVKEQAVIYFKAAYGKLHAGKLFIKRKVALGIKQTTFGAHNFWQ